MTEDLKNWWEREPEPLSDEERRLRAAMDAYEKHFGEPYFFQFGFDHEPPEETIKRIEHYIKTNKKKKRRRYKEGVLY